MSDLPCIIPTDSDNTIHGNANIPRHSSEEEGFLHKLSTVHHKQHPTQTTND